MSRSIPFRSGTSLLAFLLGACTLGGTASDWPVARRPAGVQVKAFSRSKYMVAGELLAVQDGALIVRQAGSPDEGPALVRLPIEDVEVLDVSTLGIRVPVGRHPTADQLDRMRSVSRFPQGISPTILERLLAATGQDSLVTAGSPPDPPPDPNPRQVAVPSRDTAPHRELLADIRAAHSIYRDRARAIEAGYRAVGPDAPGMGQHWIQPGLLAAGHVDPAHAPILMYAAVRGRPTLVAVAFARPGGPPPPSEASPIPAEAWHVHAASVEEEALVPSHALGLGQSGSGPGLGVVHVWAWVENPAGPFVPNNWSLPYVRAGLAPPEHVDIAAGRALSLAFTGKAYLVDQLRTFGALSPDAEASAEARVEAAAAEVRGWLADRNGREVTAEDEAWLGSRWRSLGADLEGRLAPGPRRRLAPVLEPGGHREP